MEKVYVLKTHDRAKAVPRLFARFDLSEFKDRKIADEIGKTLAVG